MYACGKCGLIDLPAVQVDQTRQEVFTMTSTVLVISVVIVVSVMIIVDRMRSTQIVEARKIDQRTAGHILRSIEEFRKRFRG